MLTRTSISPAITTSGILEATVPPSCPTIPRLSSRRSPLMLVTDTLLDSVPKVIWPPVTAAVMTVLSSVPVRVKVKSPVMD